MWRWVGDPANVLKAIAHTDPFNMKLESGGSVFLCSCVFPFYCPVGSAHPRACPGGSEALNGTGLRVSKETCCRLCEAGTYCSQALDSQTCQPCPPGFSCHQGEFGKPGCEQERGPGALELDRAQRGGWRWQVGRTHRAARSMQGNRPVVSLS